MKRLFAFALVFVLCLCAWASASTWCDTSGRINYYYQYDGAPADEPGVYDLLLAERLKARYGHDSIYYDSSTSRYLTGRGCGLFSFAHAYQYLCGRAMSLQEKADILYNYLAVHPVWSNTSSSMSPPNGVSYYRSYLAGRSGISTYSGDLSTFSRLRSFFEGSRSVIIINAPGHFIIGTGVTTYQGEQYVLVVDSVMSGTLREGRLTRGMSLDFSTVYTPYNAPAYAESVHQYWIPYSQFASKCKIRYAFVAGSIPPPPAVKPEKTELILFAGDTETIHLQSGSLPAVFETETPDICRVDENGIVTALKPGRGRVILTNPDEAEIFSAAVEVYVIALPEEAVRVIRPGADIGGYPFEGELPEGAYAVYGDTDTLTPGVRTVHISTYTAGSDPVHEGDVILIVMNESRLVFLPSQTVLIEEEAFADISALFAVIPESVSRISSGAFAGTPLQAAFVLNPDAVVAADAFPEDCYICRNGSALQKWICEE